MSEQGDTEYTPRHDYLTEVPVLLTDLRALGRTLETAANASLAEDLRQAYRQMTDTRRAQSRLTVALQQAAAKVGTYLAEANRLVDEQVPPLDEGIPDDIAVS